jgi:hypothetical protein
MVTSAGFPASPVDFTVPTLGYLRIQIASRFRPLFEGYPGYTGETGDPDTSYTLELPLLSDAATVLGSSAGLEQGSAEDTDGVAAGSAGTLLSDAYFPVVPAGFDQAAGGREAHLELYSLLLQEAAGGTSGVSLRAGSGEDLAISAGELESLSAVPGAADADLPARGFLDLVLELMIPPDGGFAGGAVYNPDPVAVAADEVASLPPRAVYRQLPTGAVPLLVRDGNTVMVDGKEDSSSGWTSGELFGWVTLAGLGFGYADTPDDRAAFEAEVTAGEDAGPPCYDLDDSGVVDGGDALIVAKDWGNGSTEAAVDPHALEYDFDQDGVVTVFDAAGGGAVGPQLPVRRGGGDPRGHAHGGRDLPRVVRAGQRGRRADRAGRRPAERRERRLIRPARRAAAAPLRRAAAGDVRRAGLERRRPRSRRRAGGGAQRRRDGRSLRAGGRPAVDPARRRRYAAV